MDKRPAVQLEYFVPDVREAAASHSATFGSGPFVHEENVPLSNCDYRGRSIELSTSAALGYWGPVIVMFVQQNSTDPSVFTERRPESRPRFHSVSLLVEDVDAEITRMGAHGLQVALTADVGSYGNFKLIYVDALERYGHFFKLLPKATAVVNAFARLREASESFTGGDPWIDRS